MKRLLLGLLPRLFPGWVEHEHFLCVKHDGKSDLDTSIPRKLRAWQFPGDRFVIVRDNDNANCLHTKARLSRLCADSGRPDSLVRLVCQELEGWYLGELNALAQAYDDAKLNSPRMRKRFADPDTWEKPSVELVRMIPSFQKGSGASLMGQELLSGAGNNSRSFQVFEAGIRRIAYEMGWGASSPE